MWAVEHHALEWYAHMSAPEIFLTWVAARTQRMRIGHGVVCMPFNYNHPVRVAERAATLDILSGGRVNLGAGRGATRQEMSLCQVDPERTYPEVDEALRIIGSVWQHDTFEWHGKLLDIEPAPDKYFKVLPRPVQRPHPPLYLACTKKDTVRLAAEYGVGALVMGFGGVEEIRSYRKIYDEAAATTRTPETRVSTEINHTLVALCPTVVLDDADLARKMGMRGQQFFSESIAYWYGGGEPPSLELGYDNIEENLRRGAKLTWPGCRSRTSRSRRRPGQRSTSTMPTAARSGPSSMSNSSVTRAPTRSCAWSRWAWYRSPPAWRPSGTGERRSSRTSGVTDQRRGLLSYG